MAKLKTVRELSHELEKNIERALRENKEADPKVLAIDASMRIESLKHKRSGTLKNKLKHYSKFLQLKRKLDKLQSEVRDEKE